jgi:predicted DNA binding CopG/RHH family protein
MKQEYDLTKARRNPHAKRLKTRVTIKLDAATIDYLRDLAEETEIPYQTLINLYLGDCAASGERLKMDWKPRGRSKASR